MKLIMNVTNRSRVPHSHHIIFLLIVLLLLLPCTVASSPSEVAYPTVTDEDCSAESGEDITVPVRREVYGKGRILDISHKYDPDMPSAVSENGRLGSDYLWLRSSIKNGSVYNLSMMKFSVHSGTHVDAPGHYYDHYYDAGFDVDTLDLEVLNGPALVVDVPRDKNITAEVMKSILNIPKGVRRVLFRTLNTDRKLMLNKEYDTSATGFTEDGAKWLVQNTDIKLVGIDYLNVAAFVDKLPVHYAFLDSREIIIVEGLNLEGIPVGLYASVHCLPLRLTGSEGSPARKLMWNREYDTSASGFMEDGAKWLVQNTDIKLVGIDYLNVAAFVDVLPVHYAFLDNREIILVEGLKLEGVPAGLYSSVHCLPLRLIGSDGSPARCILIK